MGGIVSIINYNIFLHRESGMFFFLIFFACGGHTTSICWNLYFKNVLFLIFHYKINFGSSCLLWLLEHPGQFLSSLIWHVSTRPIIPRGIIKVSIYLSIAPFGGLINGESAKITFFIHKIKTCDCSFKLTLKDFAVQVCCLSKGTVTTF